MMDKMKSKSSSTIATALAEILSRLAPDEKREFAKVFDWDEFEKIRKEITKTDGRRYGDPKIYVQGNPRGVNFEVSEDKLIEFIRFLSETLPYEQVSVFIRKGKTSEERVYSKGEFNSFLISSGKMLVESYSMIEFGANTLISGGGGCLDLDLEKENIDLVRRIAEAFLKICGFSYRFSKDEFSAIVWESTLEVEE